MGDAPPHMTDPLHLGLIAQGGRDWVGGMELTKNLVVATSRYCRTIGRPLRITIFSREPLDTAAVDVSESLSVDHAVMPHSDDQAARLQLLATECDRRGIDFVYPCLALPNDARCRAAAWIPDLQHCRLPVYFSDDECARRSAAFAELGRTSDDIVFSSHDARDDFREFFPDATAATHVVPFRITIPARVLDSAPDDTRLRYHLPERFLLMCGQLWAHKNHMLVLDALESLVETHPDMLVVMTGRLSDYRNPTYIDEVLASIHTRNLSDHIRLLGLVPKPDQIQLMRACQAVIQPSLFEGWSTVVQEAQSLGQRLILSDIPSHLEQSPPHAVFFARRCATELADAMMQAWTTPGEDRASREAEARQAYEPLILAFGATFVGLVDRMISSRRQAIDQE